ncbi:unnamed protein product [Musa textilis]
MASSDSSLDLQVVRSNFVRVDTRALGLPEALRMVVASVHENITCIVFHPSLHIHDKDLNLIAEGCPHLKRLVLPCWDLISEFAMRNAIEGWRELESMTMAGFSWSPRLFTTQLIMVRIKTYCKNFSKL